MKKMKPRIGKGILRRKCEMNMGSKIYRLASRRLRMVCFGTHRFAKVQLVRLKHPELQSLCLSEVSFFFTLDLRHPIQYIPRLLVILPPPKKKERARAGRALPQT